MNDSGGAGSLEMEEEVEESPHQGRNVVKAESG